MQLGRWQGSYAQFIVSCQASFWHAGPGKINVQLASGLRRKMLVYSLLGISISLLEASRHGKIREPIKDFLSLNTMLTTRIYT